jgi:hypothetical protein
MLIAALLAPSIVVSQRFVQPMKLILIYAPGAELTLLNMLNTTTLNSEVVYINPTPPYDYLSDLMKLVDPSLSDLVVYVNETNALVNGTLVDLTSLVNQSYVNSAWGGNFTVFIGVPGVNPNSTAMSLNPYFNISSNYIPPAIFSLKFNESFWWSILNTSLVVSNTSSGLVVNLTNYNVVEPFDNTTLETPSFAVSVPSGLNISEGVYYLKFKIISSNASHLTLFFPGTLKASGWLNNFYGTFTEPVVLLELYPQNFLRSLPVEALVWAFNQSCRFYSFLVVKATWFTSGGVYLMYYPLFQRLNSLRGFVNETTFKDLINLTLNNINDIINDFRVYLGVNTTVIIYNPYTRAGGGSAVGLPVIKPGLYDATSSQAYISELIQQGYNLSVARKEGRVLVKILDYNKLGFGQGFALLVKPTGFNQTLALSGVVDEDVFEHLLLSYSKLYYPSASNLVSIGFQLQDMIDNLTKTVDNLNQQVASMNETINVLLVNAGNCNATVANLTVQLLDYESKMSGAENMLNQAREYLALGLVAVLAVNLGLFYLLRKGLKYTE